MKTMKEMSTHDLDTLLLQSQSPANLHESGDEDEEENIAIESTKYMLIVDLKSDYSLTIEMWMTTISRS